MSKSFFERCVQDLTLPKSWINCSYGNDACPSFYTNGYQIFVDHKDPEQREVGENSQRFPYLIDPWNTKKKSMKNN